MRGLLHLRTKYRSFVQARTRRKLQEVGIHRDVSYHQDCRLLTLPRELRDQIYQELLETPVLIVIDTQNYNPRYPERQVRKLITSLRLTCKQL